MSSTVLSRGGPASAPRTHMAHADVARPPWPAARPAATGWPATGWPASAWIAALGAGLVLAMVAGAALTAPNAAARLAVDPDLTRLLRAMAVIKAVMVALGAGAVGWRFRRPTPLPFAGSYVALVWTAGAAVGAMWQLAGVGRVAVALHAAGALLVVLAWRDREFVPSSDRAVSREVGGRLGVHR